MGAALAFFLLLGIALPHGAVAQAAAQFVPPDLTSNITSRLIFRQDGLASFWKDSGTKSVVVRDRVVIDPQFWHNQFHDTGGVAVLSQSNGLDFTITSDNGSQLTPELNFSLIPDAMLVGPGGRLVFKDILLLDFANVFSYQYSDAQPYRNMGVGWPMWPTVAMAPGSRVDLINISSAYQNPAALDTCEQYTERTAFALQQQYGKNVSAPNSTSVAFKGPIHIQVVVYNGSDNSTLGNATAVVYNATFHCVPRIKSVGNNGSGLAPGVLAAAVVVPVVAVLAAAIGAWLCWRRRRQRKLSAAGHKADIVMAVELGHEHNSKHPDDVDGQWDQHPQPHHETSKVTRLPDQQAYMPPYPHASSSSAATSSVMAPNTWSGSAHGTASGGMMPAGPGGLQQYQQYSTASGSTVTVPPTPTVLGMPGHMGVPVGAAGLQPGLSHQFSSRQPSSGGTGTASQGQPYSGSYGHPSDAMRGPQTAGSGDLDRRSLINEGVGGMGRGGHNVSSSGQRVSGGSSADGSRGVPTAASGGGGARGTGGSGDGTSGGSGALSSGSTAFRSGGAGGVPALLKARSDMAVLRDLKIGPLLGRGSYGRVYKGRWKAVTVAVKIIEHMEGSPGTASSGGKKISIGREAQLATNIAHPNVVQTYQISTMTVSQRNALARTWIEEGNGHSSNLNQLSPAAEAVEGGDNDSSSSNDGNDEPQKDVLETWMIMEFCEKGSLDRAVTRKRFIRKEDGQPEMIGIYKALLDTASGLDYLHSIGVVHGDLKTANVLLKGSTRDVRGFACKITDFGLSRVLDLDATHISTRTYGTIVYMPAELLLTGRMTQSTDIYSFGLMMWELYMSSRIFNEGLSVGQIFYMIAYQNWRPDIPPGCPQGYAALMQACWHQDSEQRPAVQQVLKALQKLYLAEKQAVAAANKAAAAAAAAAGSHPEAGSPGAAAGANAAGLSTAAQGAAPARGIHPAAAARLAQTRNPNTQRISVDSQSESEHYRHAIGGDRDNQQWTYPGQQQPGSAAAAKLLTGDELVTEPVSTAAASVSGSFAGSAPEPPASTAAASETRDRRSFQSIGSTGSYGVTAPRHSSGDMGTPGRASGSGGGPSGSGSEGREEYHPWARAVSMHQNMLGDTSYHQRRPSMMHTSQRPAATAVQPGMQQQVPTRQVTPMTQPQHGGLMAPAQQQQGRQQPAAAAQQRSVGSRYHPSVHFVENEIQPAVDNEALPSESLYQNISSASNVVNTVSGSLFFGGNEDEQDTEVSGFLHMPKSPALSGQHAVPAAGRSQGGASAAAAQGFVEALTSATAPIPAASGAAGPPAGYMGSGPSSLAEIPYHYQQRPLMLQPGNLPGSPGQARMLDASGSTGWASISTGTMPSVVADDRLTPWPTTSSLGYLGASSSAATGGSAGTAGATAGPGGMPSPNSSSSRPGPVVTHAAPVAAQPRGMQGFLRSRFPGQQQVAGSQMPAASTASVAVDPAAGTLVVPLSAVRVTPGSGPFPVSSPFAQQPVVSPFAAQQQAPPSKPASSASSSAGSMRNSRTPERSTTPPVFMYRTPSGRVYVPNPTTGVPQTVREGSGTTTATSGSGSHPGSSRVGSIASVSASLHPAGPQSSGSPPDAGPLGHQHLQQVDEQSSLPAEHQEQATTQSSTGPPSSPFAALAQRAGSLFGPV
eukprot:GHUV01000946.1.p1 GENE.GHUV01000946.1~~GHUV01000946.1.p1  ORF type:complete len:1662 (+),score=542.75 GHUV01000946.1:226-5211(+)